MSDILASMLVHLQANAALTVLVSSRMYAEKLPAASTSAPNTMPAMTYQMIDEPVITSHDNKTLFKARVQVDAYGSSYKSARALKSVLLS